MVAMITAVVLTHNNETTLKRTLTSIRWCDELLVIDDFSTDKTVAIAKQYKANVIPRHVGADFAAQRNFGLKKARGDWVFFVDSDEVVSGGLKNEILEAVDNPNVVGYYLSRVDYLYGRRLLHGETGSVRLLRLAKRDAGQWQQPVHEVWGVDGPKVVLREPIFHYPHPNVAQFLTDINWYSTVYATYLFSQKKKEPQWFIVIYPVAKFIINYVVKLGFLDGMPGMIVAMMMSFHSFLVRAKLRMLWQTRGDST